MSDQKNKVLVLSLLTALRAPCELGSTERWVLTALASYDGLDRFTPSIPRLAETTGLARRTVETTIRSLAASGWLSVTTAPGLRNNYTLNVERIEQLAADVMAAIRSGRSPSASPPGSDDDQRSRIASAAGSLAQQDHPTSAAGSLHQRSSCAGTRAAGSLQGSEKDTKGQKKDTRAAARDLVLSCYVDAFTRARGVAPVVGGRERRAAEQLLAALGGEPSRAECVIRAAYAADWHSQHATIVTIAGDPSKFLSSETEKPKRPRPVAPDLLWRPKATRPEEPEPTRGSGPPPEMLAALKAIGTTEVFSDERRRAVTQSLIDSSRERLRQPTEGKGFKW